MRFKNSEINFTLGLLDGILILFMSAVATAALLIPVGIIAFALVGLGLRVGQEPTLGASLWTLLRWSLVGLTPLTIGLCARSQILQGRTDLS